MKPRGSKARGIVQSASLIVSGMVCAMPAGATGAFQSRDLAPDPAWQATQGSLAVSGTGLTAGLANPAGAFGQDRAQVEFSHLLWAGDLAREWAAFGAPLGPRVGFVTDAALLHGPRLAGYDAEGVETGSFGVTEWNAGGSVGVDIGRGLNLGFGARVHRLEDPTDPVTGVGVSAGARWLSGAQSFGVSVTDLGSARSSGSKYDLPTHWRAGVERDAPWYRAGASLRGDDEATVLALGFALRATSWVSLLGGMSTGQRSDDAGVLWSSGLQVQHQGILVGYAVHPAGPLGTTHQFSVAVPLRGDRGSWTVDRRPR